MSRTESTAELALLGSELGPDPELEALPVPRRPGRNLTLLSLGLTALASIVMSVALTKEVAYGLRAAPPVDLGALAHFSPSPELANTWVRAEALLGTHGAVRYGRPLESDTYRLAPVAGNPKIWVQVRVPEGMEGPHFVPPTSFVGRLLPVADAGLRHGGLRSSVAEAATGQGPASSMPSDAWLLIDGEAPSTTRWTIGVLVLLLGFLLFSSYGLYQLLSPVKDP